MVRMDKLVMKSSTVCSVILGTPDVYPNPLGSHQQNQHMLEPGAVAHTNSLS
jgi:hypothetical protein